MEDFLKSLKVGDEVAVDSGYNNQRIEEIDGETPKFWKIKKALYDKTNGRARGSGEWYSFYIRELTPEIKDKIIKRYAIGKIGTFDFNKLNTSELKKIIYIYNDAVEKEGEQ